MNYSLSLNAAPNFKGSNTTNLSWLDYFIFIVMLLISLCTGTSVKFFDKIEATLSYYLMGGKRMKIIPIAVSLVACHMSTFTVLAVPAEVYQYGANYLWSIFPLVVMCLLKIYVYVPVFYNLQLTSIYEYLEKRFDRKTRLFASILYVLKSLFFLAVITHIATLACHTVSGLNSHLLTITVCGVCVLYTTFGTLKSIVWIDIFQTVVLGVALSTFLIIGVVKQGGPGVLLSRAKNGGRLDLFDFDLNPTKHDSFWIIVIGRTVGWMAEFGINQCSVLKYSSVPTFSDCKKTIIYFTIGVTLLQIGSVSQGLNIYSIYSDCDPVAANRLEKYDGIVAFYVLDTLKNITGIYGLFMACAFSASLSTLSTTLNSLSGVIYKDFICNIFKKKFTESQALYIVKSIVFVTGTLCILLTFVVENLGGMFQVTLNILSLGNGPQLGMFSLGMLIPKANSNGALYGGIAGFISGASLMLSSMYYGSKKMLPNFVKPMSTAGCRFNQTNLDDIYTDWTIANTTSASEANFFARISFYYYSLITSSITLVVGIIVSYLTNKNADPVDKNLLSPVCHSFLPKDSNNVAEDHLLKNLDKSGLLH